MKKVLSFLLTTGVAMATAWGGVYQGPNGPDLLCIWDLGTCCPEQTLEATIGEVAYQVQIKVELCGDEYQRTVPSSSTLAIGGSLICCTTGKKVTITGVPMPFQGGGSRTWGEVKSCFDIGIICED